MKTKLKLHGLLLVILCASNFARSQGTAFTYQGQLNNGANPANGNYDLRFTLFGAGSGGSAVAGPVTNAPVGVSNGLFTVSLDFGNSGFTGAVRWLEIGVRSNGSATAYTILGQRQQLTPTPYAIFAGSASNVVSGSVVQSLNGFKDNVTLAAGTNVTITPSGNTLTIASAGAGGSGIWSVNGNNAYYTAGRVGIGTSAPQGLLDINSVGSDSSALFVAADPGAFGRGGIIHHQFATYGWQELAQVTGSSSNGYLTFHYVNRTAPGTKVTSDVLTLRGNGNVGIGTTTPSSKVEIAAQDALKMTGFQPFLTLNDSSAGNARSRIQGATGGMNLFTESYLSGINPFAYICLNNNGNVGLGSSTPISKLDIVTAQDALSMIGYEPFLTFWDSGAGYARSRIQGVNGDLVFATESYLSGANPTAFIDLRNSGNVGVGTANPLATLDVNGTTRTKILTITGGADLAEPFEMSHQNIPKGAVVIIDDEHYGKLKLSTRAYDTRVAGVVSGANGINPGISLSQDGVNESGQNVALSGRVYVQADAAYGAIKPGDLLTTSETPGHAMKVADHGKAQGAILGKAMSSLKQGKGMVLVLVTLQ